MIGMSKQLVGVEGYDILYYLRLLNFNDTPDDVLFYPLNDIFDQHSPEWIHDTQVKSKNFRKVVFYDLFHHGDECHELFVNKIKNFQHHNKVYLTNNFAKFEIQNVEIVPWNYMWNRTKAFYVEKPDFKGPDTPFLHHYAGAGRYILPEINYNNRSKLFLNLSARTFYYRTKLYEQVSKHQDLGYISYWGKGLILGMRGSYIPISNSYYTNSYFSVYVESNCTNPELIHVTEKAFEPLIKGHFILPFGNPGSVAHIKNMGFKLPAFIDYSYDEIQDVELRFAKYLLEFERLLTLDWPKVYIDNVDTIIHNQKCIDTLSYDDSILKIFQ